MRIFITIPSLQTPHGGLRIIVEWANRLQAIGHEVILFNQAGHLKCSWMNVKVRITNSTTGMGRCECVIITSPHAIHLQDFIPPGQKCFIFCQMAEHLFRPNDKVWMDKCRKFYTSPFPMFSISKWNIDMFRGVFGRTAETHYITNGVNLDDFPIINKPKDGITVLVEGWEPGNPTKDVDHIGPKVAARLKEQGYKIIAYSSQPLKTMPHVPDEYYQRPNIQQLNELYERATILIKATLCDARSCAPMEAMTKGTVTVRAIDRGDDDLQRFNSVRTMYKEDMLFAAATFALRNADIIECFSNNCRRYVQKECNWDIIIQRINGILCQNAL